MQNEPGKLKESDLAVFEKKCEMLDEICDTIGLVLKKDAEIMTELMGDVSLGLIDGRKLPNSAEEISRPLPEVCCHPPICKWAIKEEISDPHLGTLSLRLQGVSSNKFRIKLLETLDLLPQVATFFPLRVVTNNKCLLRM